MVRFGFFHYVFLKMSGRVPKSQAAKVADVYTRFTGHKPRVIAEVPTPIAPRAAGVIGYIDALEYTTVRDGNVELYRHRFAKSDRPMMCVGPDRKVFLLGGNYRFTELGIVDGSDRKHANAK